MARYFRRTMTEVKICGLSDTDMIDCALDAGADHIGFVHFEKSPRHLDFDQIAALSTHVANRAQTWIVLHAGPAEPRGRLVDCAWLSCPAWVWERAFLDFRCRPEAGSV